MLRRMIFATCCAAIITFPALAGSFYKEKPQSCVVAGCSGQVCIEADKAEGIMSTCEWTPEYQCYSQHGVCEVQENGGCGWTQTEAFTACLASPPKDDPALMPQ